MNKTPNQKHEPMKIDFNGLGNYLLEQGKKQGLSFLLILVLAGVYFEKSETCNEKIILMYSKNQIEMQKVIEANTRAIETFTAILNLRQHEK